MSSDSPNVFLSYSHQDKRLKERLATHLSVLRGRLTVWEDRQLRAGDDWLAEISGAIESADVAVLLISADFLASDFISREEVPRLLRRREQDGLAIVPVLLKSCPWEAIPWLAAMQIRPTDARPVAALRGDAREQALAAVAQEILQLAEKPAPGPTGSESSPPASPTDPPVPDYSDPSSKELAEALEEAYTQHEELVTTGGDSAASLQAILSLKRRLRQEGQLKPGDFLADGRYRLLEVLGRGGFSTVFKAYDRRHSGLVAVKVLHPQYAQDRSRRERFFRGARKMGELQHQAIVRVIEPQEEDEGYHYFVMEYVEGGDLRQAVKAGRIRGHEGLALLGEVAEALDLAHRRGVIHRDVKPANILLTTDGRAKLTDFDLVRALDTTAGTRTGSTLGTVLYAAPEAMLMAETADVSADVYSLAMTVAFVLHGDEIPMTFLRNAESFFAALAVPESVKQTLRRATALEPSERWGSAAELCRVLNEGLASEDVVRLDPKPATESPALVVASDGKWSTLEFGGVTQRLRWIPPGEFMMGSPNSEVGRFKREGPQHKVTLTEGFWLADTPCTQALWQAVMGENPSRFKSPRRPVEQVSWHDCQRFIARLNQLLPGSGFKLPSEAEWEYACRAGTQGASYGNRDAAAVGGSHEVGQKSANPWGLYDMLGNVWEWCEDGQRRYTASPEVDPEGPLDGSERVIRGGSWYGHTRRVRAAARSARAPGDRYAFLGFRLARVPERGAR